MPENLHRTAADLGQQEAATNPAEWSAPASAPSGAESALAAITHSIPPAEETGGAGPMSQPADAPAPAQPVVASPAEHWIEEINTAFGYSAGWVIKTGQLLSQAKRQLPPRQWLAAFESRKLRFGLRTAEMLMALGRHPILTKTKYISSLPPAWSILYLLSRLPPEVLEQGIIDGVIHPELKLAEARRLLQSARASGLAEPSKFNSPAV